MCQTVHEVPASVIDTVKGRLSALILLGGWVRPTEFSRLAGRNLLDFPIDSQHTLLSHWLDEAAELCGAYGIDRLNVRVLLDQASPKVVLPVIPPSIAVSIEQDPSELRGTGGVLRDACAPYDDDDLVLVANASQIVSKPLHEIFATLLARQGDVAIISHHDGSPVTLMLIRCKCLKELPSTGFFDLKEQGLPSISKRHAIKVAEFAQPVCFGIRTANAYIAALQAVTTTKSGRNEDPFVEKWKSAFQVVEKGAEIGAGAKLHDSVILGGSNVGRNVILVRSVVCRGAQIAPGSVLIDKLASASGTQSSREGAT